MERGTANYTNYTNVDGRRVGGEREMRDEVEVDSGIGRLARLRRLQATGMSLPRGGDSVRR